MFPPSVGGGCGWKEVVDPIVERVIAKALDDLARRLTARRGLMVRSTPSARPIPDRLPHHHDDATSRAPQSGVGRHVAMHAAFVPAVRTCCEANRELHLPPPSRRCLEAPLSAALLAPPCSYSARLPILALIRKRAGKRLGLRKRIFVTLTYPTSMGFSDDAFFDRAVTLLR